MTTDTSEHDIPEQKLTNWKNEPSLRDLIADFDSAKDDHATHISNVERWLDNLHVKGSAKVKTGKGRSKLVPKTIRKHAEWRYSSLSAPFLDTPDVFNVRPKTHMDRLAAIQNELVLNHQFNNQLNKVDLIDEYVRTAVDEGTAVLRVGWDFEEITEEQEFPVFDYQPVTDPKQIRMLQRVEAGEDLGEEWTKAMQLTMEFQEPVAPVQVGTEMREVTVTIKNQPSVKICDYRNTVIDPTCNGVLEDAKFVTYSYESCIADLQKQGKRYKNLDKIILSDASPLNDPDHAVGEDAPSFTFLDDPRKKFVVYEYWGFQDIHGTGTLVPIVASWAGNTLIRMEESPFPDRKLPFVKVSYLPVRKSIFGEPDGELLEENQKIIGAVTRGMIDIMGRSANGQTGTRKDALDVVNRRRFLNGQDYEYNGSVDPRLAFHMHTYPEIPQSAQIMLQLQNDDADSLSGVKAFSNGITGAALGESASLGRDVLGAASKREAGILRRLAKGMELVGRKIIAMNAEFLGEEEIIRITDDEFVPIKRDDLAGNFDLELSISTPEEDNARAQELSFILQTLGPDEDPMVRRMILADITRLRKMPALSKKLENYKPQPNPLVEEKMKLENLLLEAQIRATMGKADESAAEAILDRAKAITEQAKAANLQSDTDIKNLDFIEQESGVKQERDLQKHGAQSRAQAATKILEHRLRMMEPNKKPAA